MPGRVQVVHPLPAVQALCSLLGACTTLTLTPAEAPSPLLFCLVLRRVWGCVSIMLETQFAALGCMRDVSLVSYLASMQRLEMSPQQLQRCPSEPGPLILPVLGPATPEPRSRRRGGSAYGAAVLGSQPHEGFVPGEARACGG